MTKRLALTKDGKLTYCTSSEENIGKGRCNHIFHQNNNESTEDFCKRVKDIKLNDKDNNKIEIENLKIYDKIKLIESEDANDEILDILVNDNDWHVSAAVAKCGIDKYLDILVNDEDWTIRAEVARYGRDKDLDILVNDEDWYVRAAVAKHGRDKDLNILINDKSWYVRKAVVERCKDKNLDIIVNNEM